MTRAAVGGLVVIVWLFAMGWNARRELFRPDADRLAIGAATLPPGTAYFAIDAGELPAGMASMQIDTLPGRAGFHIIEQYSVRLPGLGDAGRTDIRLDTWLGPGVTLDSLTHRTARGADTVHVRVDVTGDTLRWEGRGSAFARPLPGEGTVLTEATWPLRFVAAGGGETGEVRRVTLLDPVNGGLREVDVRTLERTSRVFADSADTDPETGAWIVAGTDTVGAWRVARTGPSDASSLPGTAGRSVTWIDEDGRYIETDLPGGLHLRRTAFELAFFREDP